MANAGTGHQSYVRYGYENVYGTALADGSLSTYFGHNVKFTASPKNNIDRIPQLNSRNYAKYAAKKFEGSWSADFNVSNMYWMKGVLGSCVDAGATPYTHTYNEATNVSGMTIMQSEDLDTDCERTFTGSVIDKASLTCNTGEVVGGKLDGFYQKEVKDTTLNTTGNSTDAEEVFTFSNAILEVPTATTIALVQSMDISITNSMEMLWGFGSRFPTQRVAKQRIYEFKINKIREKDSDFLDAFYSGSTAQTMLANPNKPADIATLQFTLTNNLSGSAQRSFVMKVDSLQVEDYSTPLEPIEALKEGVTLYALNLNSTSKAIYSNNTAAHP